MLFADLLFVNLVTFFNFSSLVSIDHGAVGMIEVVQF